jgi:hypothetical protein
MNRNTDTFRSREEDESPPETAWQRILMTFKENKCKYADYHYGEEEEAVEESTATSKKRWASDDDNSSSSLIDDFSLEEEVSSEEEPAQ